MFGVISLGVYMMLKSWDISVENVNWIPLASFSWTIFIESLGLQMLELTIVSEIMPETIKDTCVSFFTAFIWILTFINTKYLPFLVETIAFHGAMYFFAGICLVSVIILILIMPETKGKNHEEIMKLLK